ncbi:MAG: formylglycine-generating enzyme family protein [Methylococcaceae bacterium]|nr:MAG: formylglycine-generating enzyme family protein [Methylococcaceae bacterium]
MARYHFGNSVEPLGDYAWYDKNAYALGEAYAHPVAQKKPNAWGLYDMHGNVWEWVEDCWHDNYHGAPDNGDAWTVECGGTAHVLRGGSWNLDAFSLRAANRSNYSPHHHSGFRVVRALSPATR